MDRFNGVDLSLAPGDFPLQAHLQDCTFFKYRLGLTTSRPLDLCQLSTTGDMEGKERLFKAAARDVRILIKAERYPRHPG